MGAANSNKSVMKMNDDSLDHLDGWPEKLPEEGEDYYSYSLVLNDGCYYVGMTRDPEIRLKQHVSGCGANWTELHEPVSVNHIFTHPTENRAKWFEKVRTQELAKKHGAENVRGGPWHHPNSEPPVPE